MPRRSTDDLLDELERLLGRHGRYNLMRAHTREYEVRALSARHGVLGDVGRGATRQAAIEDLLEQLR
jgi:hypothetical protein